MLSTGICRMLSICCHLSCFVRVRDYGLGVRVRVRVRGRIGVRVRGRIGVKG